MNAGPVPTSDSPDRRPCLMDSRLSQALFWIWVLEIAVSGFNYAVLMNRIYRPRFGELKADLAPEKRSSWLMMESETGATR